MTPAFDPAKAPQPPYTVEPVKALWDTGATDSMITTSAVAKLGIVPTGRTQVQFGGGVEEIDRYLVNIFLPNNVGVPGVLVGELGTQNTDFELLIGMDIISQSDLSITNVGGETWMTFRIPSVQQVDFVVEANRIKYANVKRNDPCLCGSGMKFKYCHGGPNPPS